MRWAAALALTAALFHVLNHSLFKSLLFFGAGAVLAATGERDMEHLGGLSHRMAYTSFAFLVGCAAISALPPLNGFASEWLTFQAILQSPQLPQWGLKMLVPTVGALLALSAALAAACFVRPIGVTFLGRPRSDAGKTGPRSRSLFARGDVCPRRALPAGRDPARLRDRLAGAGNASLVGARMPVQTDVQWLSIVPIAESRSSYNGLLVFAFIAASASLAAFAIHRFASNKIRPRAGMGLRVSGRQPNRPNIPRRASPSRSGACSAAPCSAPASGSRCRRPGTAGRRASSSRCTILLWELIYDPIVRAVTFLADA